ncbi:GntR family transcriptional regulator [Lacticaseibacillus thailandensis]|uniref:Transcription regulator n=1 Tax=Lacticaseibacillus thailandensis DSM 22698 = JCM 13996 TaxID=1423810 RepID=A0A0R2C4V2_9LACO|nr:GntR family transcriptional regulator [Lacticaseibacillus thailandensis]KRM86765.1 transcription regulator [Lacticaseibacillus thailandensis DSM 22698 = JCM 13996]
MYHEIAEDIIRSIHEGLYTDKLPTEAELMATYDVSRNTIRRAIDVIYQRGLLRRIQGSGYYVNKMPQPSKTVINLVAGAGASLHSPDNHLTSRIVTFDKIKADPELVQPMKLQPDSELYRVVRLRYLNGQLYCLEEAYYSTGAVPYLPVEAVNGSIFDFIAENYHVHITASEEYIFLATLAHDQATVMGQQPGKQVLALEQTNFYGNSVAFNYSTTYFVYPGLRFYSHSFPVSHS